LADVGVLGKDILKWIGGKMGQDSSGSGRDQWTGLVKLRISWTEKIS
jgi:hypothetical protein